MSGARGERASQGVEGPVGSAGGRGGPGVLSRGAHIVRGQWSLQGCEEEGKSERQQGGGQIA